MRSKINAITIAKIETALRKLYVNVCLDEIQTLLDQAFLARRGADKALTEMLLERLNNLYPLFHPGLMERAIFLDEAGQSQAAVDHMLNAIIIEPQEHLRWHSLSVILRNLGARTDADIAFALSKAIEAAA